MGLGRNAGRALPVQVSHLNGAGSIKVPAPAPRFRILCILVAQEPHEKKNLRQG